MRRVDFPTPGSPPTRTRLPVTIPPPRTLLSSSQASARRGAPLLEISLRATGCEVAALGLALPRPSAALRTWNSFTGFSSSQRGHWAAPRRLSPPQSVHTKRSDGLGIGGLLSHPAGGFTSGRVAFLRLVRCISYRRRTLNTPTAAPPFIP